MNFKSVSMLSATLLLAACQTSATTGSSDNRTTASWAFLEGGDIRFSENNGVCPMLIGAFTRTDMSTLPSFQEDGSMRIDGICTYRAADAGAHITTYFYETNGSDQQVELLNVVRAISGSQPVTPLEAESDACSAMVNEATGAQTTDELNCVVMSAPEVRAMTYAVLTSDGSYFTKLRATTRPATPHATTVTEDAIAAFYAAQL